MITVDDWPISEFIDKRDNAQLDLSPEFQRRAVWSVKSQMLLVDSVARRIPAAAITLYKTEAPGGYSVYEVIDGKQRLTALFRFLDSDLTVRESVMGTQGDDDEVSTYNVELARPLYDKTYKELGTAERTKFKEYKFPVFIVTGPRKCGRSSVHPDEPKPLRAQATGDSQRHLRPVGILSSRSIAQ